MVGKCESSLSLFSSLSCLTRIIVGTSVKYQAGKKNKNSSGILHRIPTVWHRMMQLVDCQKSHVISAFFMFADMLNLCIACLRIFFVPLMLAYNLRKGLLKIWTEHSLRFLKKDQVGMVSQGRMVWTWTKKLPKKCADSIYLLTQLYFLHAANARLQS